MEDKPSKVKIHWFWGFVGCLEVLGFILKEPLYYVFFSFFLFFLEPVLKKLKSKQTRRSDSLSLRSSSLTWVYNIYFPWRVLTNPSPFTPLGTLTGVYPSPLQSTLNP